jgi:hypothetical protein
VARNKGDKDYTKSEKQLLISLINDYSLFGAHDDEIIQMLSVKLGKKISETLFYRLKKESMTKRGESGEWLDYYTRFHFVEYYRKRIEEVELIQRKLLKMFLIESGKPDEKQNKFLINQLAKTIADNSKVLAEFGMAPPILAKLKSIMLSNISNNYNGNNLNYVERNNIDDEINLLRIQRQSAKSAIFPVTDSPSNDDHSSQATMTYDDPQRVF